MTINHLDLKQIEHELLEYGFNLSWIRPLEYEVNQTCNTWMWILTHFIRKWFRSEIFHINVTQVLLTSYSREFELLYIQVVQVIWNHFNIKHETVEYDKSHSYMNHLDIHLITHESLEYEVNLAWIFWIWSYSNLNQFNMKWIKPETLECKGNPSC